MIHKRPGYDPFFAENPFSPADELVFMGLVARSCHFDVTACAEARRLAQRAKRLLRGFSALWASRRASRAGWIKFIIKAVIIMIITELTDNLLIMMFIINAVIIIVIKMIVIIKMIIIVKITTKITDLTDDLLIMMMVCSNKVGCEAQT